MLGCHNCHVSRILRMHHVDRDAVRTQLLSVLGYAEESGIPFELGLIFGTR